MIRVIAKDAVSVEEDVRSQFIHYRSLLLQPNLTNTQIAQQEKNFKQEQQEQKKKKTP